MILQLRVLATRFSTLSISFNIKTELLLKLILSPKRISKLYKINLFPTFNPSKCSLHSFGTFSCNVVNVSSKFAFTPFTKPNLIHIRWFFPSVRSLASSCEKPLYGNMFQITTMESNCQNICTEINENPEFDYS